MWIWHKFIEGGLPFMLALLVINLVIIYFIIRKIIDLFVKVPGDKQKLKKGLPEILQLATFALFAGIFFQVYGLYQVLDAIEQLGQVSQALLAGGLKVSMITTIYGACIFGITGLIWFFLNQRYRHLAEKYEQP